MAFDWNQFQPFEGGGIVAPDSGRTIDQPMLEKAPQLPGYDPGSLGYTYLTDPSAGGPMRSIGDPPFGDKSGGGIKFDPGPNTPSNPFYNNTGFAGGGTPPGFWNPPLGMRPEPIVDPSRYDPNLTYDDYYRDYHAPDREAVLRGVPNQPVYHTQGQVGGGSPLDQLTRGYPGMENDPLGVNYSNDLRSKQGLPPLSAEQWGWSQAEIGAQRPYQTSSSGQYGSLNQLGQMYQQMHSGGGGNFLGGALGGMFGGAGRAAAGALGGLFGGGRSAPGGIGGVMQQMANQATKIRTPDGREMSIPAEHLQEALRRGATKIG